MQQDPKQLSLNAEIASFLFGKPDAAVKLFYELISKFYEIGPLQLRASKTMILLENKSSIAQVIYFGSNFIDIVFQFQEAYNDNLCFRKIALVPGTGDYNHHLRIMLAEDLNEEVFGYMKKAYQLGTSL